MNSFTNKIKLIFTFVAFFICAALALDFPDIDINTNAVYTWHNYDYQFHPEPRSWDQAESICQDFGGHLSSILDEKENQLMKLITDKTCWIGMNKVETHGYWEWIDEARSDFSSWLGDVIPTPDLNICVIFNWNLLGMWGDVSCNRGFPFICKRPSTKCEWGNDVIGAPKPIVKTSFYDNELTIKVQMAEKYGTEDVKYALGFNDLDLEEGVCQSSNPLFSDQWEVEDKGCFRVFTLKMPLNDFMSFASPVVSCAPGSDIIRMAANLKMAYIDDTVEDIPCIVTEFETDVEVKTILIGDSTVEFEYDGNGDGGSGGGNSSLINPSFISLSNNDDGKLIIDVVITPTNPLALFKDFDFFSHSAGINFQCSYLEDCDDNIHHQYCKYRLTCVSTTSEDDYSGLLKLNVKYEDENGEKDAKLKFNLLYQLIEEPPAVENVIQTMAKLTESDFTGQVDTLLPDQTAYLLVETDRPIQLDRAEFAFEDVYLCCTKNRVPLLPYDPSKGQYGCVVQDSTTMDFWGQLVDGGNAQSSWDVNIVDFGSFVSDKLGLTFKPNGIEGDDKLCYIHVKSSLSLQSSKRSEASNGKYEKNTVTAVTYKSCTSSATKSSCTQSSLCSWNEQQSACLNKRYTQESSAARVFSIVGILASVAVAALLL